MVEFKMDLNEKTVYLNLMLKGEAESLQVSMRDFDCFIENDKGFIRAKNITTSREWLNILLSQVLKENKVEVPQEIVKILSVIE